VGAKVTALFLISDTGGGHRAAAAAIASGLAEIFPGRVETVCVDVFKEYFGPPFKWAPRIYPRWVSMGARSYGLAFVATDRLFTRSSTLNGFYSQFGKRLFRHLLKIEPDVAIVIHALLVRPAVVGKERLGVRIPLVSVVTDFARPHAGWFHPKVDLVLVTSAEGRRRALSLGTPEERIRDIGLLVHPRFARFPLYKGEAREELGLDPECQVVLFLGGGEGMGRLWAVVEAADRRLRDVVFLVVCGRNERLRRRLAARRWRNRTVLFGFARRMELLMRAADVLVTKAGPLSIAEGLVMGLPLLIYDAIPYQETGNARWVEQRGVGAFVTDPSQAADTLARWLNDGEELTRIAARSRELATPDSALRAARAIGSVLGFG